MTEALARDLVVLPPVSCEPVFSEDTVLSATHTYEPEAAAERRVTQNRRDGARPAMVGDDASRRVTDDPHYFPSLYMRHRWSFQLHARRFLSDKRDIDEVVQEGFLKLFLALPELETELQALAYCRRTITNLCIDRYRADQRRPRLVDLESVPVDVLSEDDDVDPVVQAEDAALVREALSLLSPLHREALIKREIEEKSLPQIAAELDIPVEQVKHVLHRARRSLRRLLVGTSVEPGVDLDVAMVLAANKARAMAAARPAGAAALAILCVLGGLLGLRTGSSQPVITGLPAGSAHLQLPGDAPRPSLGHATRPAVGPARRAPAAVPGRHAASAAPRTVTSTLRRHRRSTTARLVPSRPAVPPEAVVLPPVVPSPATPVVVPVSPGTPTAAAPPDVTLWSSHGALVAGRVESTATSRTASRTVSTVGLAFRQGDGTRALVSQVLSVSSTSSASLELSVLQTGSGGTSTQLVPDTLSASHAADGTTRIIASGRGEALAGPDAASDLQWTLSIVLASESGSLVQERLVLDGTESATEAAPSLPVPTAPEPPPVAGAAAPTMPASGEGGRLPLAGSAAVLAARDGTAAHQSETRSCSTPVQ